MKSKSTYKKQFISIPYEVMMDVNLSQTQKMIYGFVNGFKISGNICYASNAYIKSIIGVSERSVSKAVSVLISGGYIEALNPKGRSRSLMINTRYNLEPKFVDKDINLEPECINLEPDDHNLEPDDHNLEPEFQLTRNLGSNNNIVNNIINNIENNIEPAEEVSKETKIDGIIYIEVEGELFNKETGVPFVAPF